MKQFSHSSVEGTTTRWQKLNRKISKEGIAALPLWAGRWVYWNTGVRPLADRLGWKPKKYGISDPIIVYQYGKVGSSSVHYSLKRLNLDVPLYHLHFLNHLDERAKAAERSPHALKVALEKIEIARQVRREMELHPKRRWNLISLVRTPIPRLVSIFFEHIEAHFPNLLERYNNGQLQIHELTDYVLREFQPVGELRWFQGQLKELFGIDVFATPFDKARGYQMYEHGRIRLLLMRLEDLNRIAPKAMHEFLGIPDFRLVNRNMSDTKDTGRVYRDFVAALRLPAAMIEEWHHTRFAQHFYTPEELEASVARWVERAA